MKYLMLEGIPLTYYFVVGVIILLLAHQVRNRRWHNFEYATNLPEPTDFPKVVGSQLDTYTLYELKLANGRMCQAVIIDNPIEISQNGGPWKPSFQRRWLDVGVKQLLYSTEVSHYRKKRGNYRLKF